MVLITAINHEVTTMSSENGIEHGLIDYASELASERTPRGGELLCRAPFFLLVPVLLRRASPRPSPESSSDVTDPLLYILRVLLPLPLSVPSPRKARSLCTLELVPFVTCSPYEDAICGTMESPRECERGGR